MFNLKIGRRVNINVNTMQEAVDTYEAARDESEEGGSTFPWGKLTNTGTKEVFKISYNGRVWNKDGVAVNDSEEVAAFYKSING